MGFTIEDMLVVSQDRYRMKLIAGQNGWSNSISWLLMLENRTIIKNFTGKELAVTTGLGFPTEKDLLGLCRDLEKQGASGLILNTGYYIKDVPASVIRFCDANDLPLLTVPWDVYIADMIKDLSIRVFLQGATDEQISSALIMAVNEPQRRDTYAETLLPYFDVDGTFQTAILYQEGLDKMDTVERKRIGYRLQLYLTNLTHNGHFFYYDSAFVIIMNAVKPETAQQILGSFAARIQKKLPDSGFSLGIGSQVTDISNLHISYDRARAAALRAHGENVISVNFDQMGLYRLLYSVKDKELLRSMCEEPLAKLIEYDQEHSSNYTLTLENYIRYDGSIQKMSDAMFIHRNTIMYRMNNIRELLGCSLETSEERLPYRIAFMIRSMSVDIL